MVKDPLRNSNIVVSKKITLGTNGFSLFIIFQAAQDYTIMTLQGQCSTIITKSSHKCTSRIKQFTLGRKEMFYLMTHSTHFIYVYMASDIW